MTDNKALIQRAKNKDPETVAELYNQNIGLIRKKCAVFVSSRYCLEDLMQEAYFALLKAIDAYDAENTGCMFKTYLKHSLEWYLCRYRSRDKYKRDICVLDAPFSLEDPEGMIYGETIEDDAAAFEDSSIYAADMGKVYTTVKELLFDLTGNNTYYDILYMYYAENHTYKEIAEELGCSVNNVRQKITNAFRLLKKSKNEKLFSFRDDYIDSSIRHSGWKEFRQTNDSAVEWAVMKRE